MSMDFERCCLTVLLEIPVAVVLLAATGVGSCECKISLLVVWRLVQSLTLWNNVLTLTLVAGDRMFLMMMNMIWMAPLLRGGCSCCPGVVPGLDL